MRSAASSKKPVRVHMLNKESIVLVFETKATVQQLFDQICSMLSIKETQFFGVSTLVENEKRFMDMKQRISRYAPKNWGKELHRKSTDVIIASSCVLNVQFQVQFYVEHAKLICDTASRYNYYLQIKWNFLRSQVPAQDEILFTLASHALQADLGDLNPEIHRKNYFSVQDYFPAWFIDKWGTEYLLSHLPTLHAEHKGMTSFDSQSHYINQALAVLDVPMHFYKLFKNKKETKSSVVLGIFHQGIRIHHCKPGSGQGPWKLELEFMWSKVGRLFFTGRKFEIYPEGLPTSRKLVYYTGSHSRSKYLLGLLRATHSLYTSLSPYAQHMRRVDGRRTNRKYRESYISGKDLERSVDERDNEDNLHESTACESEQELDKKLKSHHSTTSHGSSHTSGIESDARQRTEEGFSQDEVDSYQSKQFVQVTEDHIVGPRSKCLSVSDLAYHSFGDKQKKQNEKPDEIPVEPEQPGAKTISEIYARKKNKIPASGSCTEPKPKFHDLLEPKTSDPLSADEGAFFIENSQDITQDENAVKESEVKFPVAYHLNHYPTLPPDVPQQKPEHEPKKEEKKKTKEEREKSSTLSKKSSKIAEPVKLASAGSNVPVENHKKTNGTVYYDDIHTLPHRPISREIKDEVWVTDTYVFHPKGTHCKERRESSEQRYKLSQDTNQLHAKRSSSSHRKHSNEAHHISQVNKHNRRHHLSSPDLLDRSEEQPRHSRTHRAQRHSSGRELTQSGNPNYSKSYLNYPNVQQKIKNDENRTFVPIVIAHRSHVPPRGSFSTVMRPEKKAFCAPQAYYTVARTTSSDNDRYYNTHWNTNASAVRNQSLNNVYDQKGISYRVQAIPIVYDMGADPMQSYTKGFRSMPAENTTSSSTEDIHSPKKMSEACMRTLSAQRKQKNSKIRQRESQATSEISYRSQSDKGGSNLAGNEATPRTPESKTAFFVDLLRTPYLENYTGVIV